MAIEKGRTYNLTVKGSGGRVISTGKAKVTEIKRVGRGHAVTFVERGETKTAPLTKFERWAA